MADEWSLRAQEVTAELISRQPENQIRPRLEPTRRAVEVLGDPQKNYGIIHITGTNGKTTTARIIERILREHGLRTGRLTSPHLVTINERIAIDGEPISDQTLVLAYEESKPLLDLVDQELIAKGESRLTFFEAFTALAFQIFSDAPIDVLVLEVGMGGEWDSTNVADADVAVFTAIDIDHSKSLGNSVAEIARTKAGIIKPASLVVSSPQPNSATEEIIQKLGTENEIYLAGKDFVLDQVVPDGHGTRFTLQSLASKYQAVWMPIIGSHQAENAATAIVAVELFLGGGIRPINDEILRTALSDSTSPGRLQVLGTEPLVVLDGAHNPAGARVLADSIRKHFGSPRAVAVLAMLQEKDVVGTLTPLVGLFERIYVTEVANPRALPAADLAKSAREILNIEVQVVGDPGAALQMATEYARSNNASVFATGSLYMVGDLLRSVQTVNEQEQDEE